MNKVLYADIVPTDGGASAVSQQEMPLFTSLTVKIWKVTSCQKR